MIKSDCTENICEVFFKKKQSYGIKEQSGLTAIVLTAIPPENWGALATWKWGEAAPHSWGELGGESNADNN